MKKLILFHILTLLISQISFSQEYGWTDISANLPGYANYNDIHFIGEEVWITGWNDAVCYSSDGGETFQIQALPQNSGISSSIFMKNNLDGYCVTYSGDILKTGDGGTNWTILHEPGGTLNSVHFPPTLDIGYTCGNSGKIYAFTDSSITDMAVAGLTATLQSIFFPINSSEGKLCGDSTVRRYLNGTWDNLQIFDSTFVYNSIFFINNLIGWIVGSQGKIVKTTDATIWNAQSNPLTNSLNAVFFINSLEGWTAGSGVLFHTVDGGENWTQELANQTAEMELRAIYITPNNNGYIVGNGVLLKYGEILGTSDSILEKLQFEIFPNPAQNKFEISSSEFATKNCKVEIHDLYGKTLLEKQILSGNENIEIDVQYLASGVYLCKIEADNIRGTKKLMIK